MAFTPEEAWESLKIAFGDPDYEEPPDEFQSDDAFMDRPSPKFVKPANKVADSGRIRFYQEQPYFYQEGENCYVRLGTKAFERAIVSILGPKRGRNGTTYDFREIRNSLERRIELHHDDTEMNGNPGLINCLNGVLDITGDKPVLRSREELPDAVFTYCIQANYREGPLNAPCFNQYCRLSLGSDKAKRRLLLEIIGYTLSDATNAKTAFFFIGKPSSGKSKILNFIEKLVGQENVSHVPLHELSDQFLRAQLYNQKINLQGELSGSPLKNIAYFKNLTGGDCVSAAFKGKDPFEFVFRGKLIFAGNVLPTSRDADVTNAFLERLTVLAFTQSVPKDKQDPDLLQKLLLEKDAIFSLAVKALIDLRKRQYHFTGADSGELQEQLKNSAEKFLDEQCKFGPGKEVFKKELWDAYGIYCRNNGEEALSRKILYDCIKNHDGVNEQRLHRKVENELVNRWGFTGIELVY